MPAPHPLRRVSTGSLSALARSQDRAPHISPSGLDFLAPALTELADEAATLAANTQKLNELHDALGTFNEAFAGWLYALKMNAFCVEWPEAPDANSFGRMQQLDTLLQQQQQQQSSALAQEAAQTSINAPSSSQLHSSIHQQQQQQAEADMTYATASSFDDPPPARGPPKSAMKKPTVGAGAGGVKKPGVGTAAMRKKRELEIAGYIDTLPLEYRGREPAMRMGMEKVIGMLMANPSGLPMKDIASAPELPQTKANKHLIALVAKKLVIKVVADGQTVYRWVGA